MEKLHKQIKCLGYYQIIAGIIGMLFLSKSVYNDFNLNGAYLLRVSIFFCLCSFSIYSGILLILEKYLKGLNYSIFIQGAQILSFAFLGYIFRFSIGVYFKIIIELTNNTIIVTDFGLVKWALSRNVNPDLIKVSFNIVAIILLFIIFRLKKTLVNNLR